MAILSGIVIVEVIESTLARGNLTRRGITIDDVIIKTFIYGCILPTEQISC